MLNDSEVIHGWLTEKCQDMSIWKHDIENLSAIDPDPLDILKFICYPSIKFNIWIKCKCKWLLTILSVIISLFNEYFASHAWLDKSSCQFVRGFYGPVWHEVRLIPFILLTEQLSSPVRDDCCARYHDTRQYIKIISNIKQIPVWRSPPMSYSTASGMMRWSGTMG